MRFWRVAFGVFLQGTTADRRGSTPGGNFSGLSGQCEVAVLSVICSGHFRQQFGKDFADVQDLCEAEVFPRGSRFEVRLECFENSVSHRCRSLRLCGAGRALPSSS
ncbi:MAG TPA: hypothetical protein DC058_14135 [Planctomycetaceae bacterium]|nr:hypothetical protein [Planctomycetaceae bacterium]